MSGFDWATLLQSGLRRLRLTPASFWALTPFELMLMLGTGTGNAPLGRQRLDELLAAYPDNRSENHERD